MSETLQFRRAILDDADEISDLVSNVSRKHIGPGLCRSGLQALLRSMDKEATVKRIADGWPGFCALVGQVLVGVAVIKPPGHLYQLFVRSDVQGKGIGRSLFEIAEKHVIDETGNEIRTVNASLNAVSVYKRLGFELNGAIMEHDGVRFQPMLRVQKATIP